MKHNADALLYQLMQEQNAKLKTMIEDLKQTSPLPNNESRESKVQVEHSIQSKKEASFNEGGSASDMYERAEELMLNETEQSTPNLKDVNQLQAENLDHLDTVISRINATMKDVLPQTDDSIPQQNE